MGVSGESSISYALSLGAEDAPGCFSCPYGDSTLDSAMLARGPAAAWRTRLAGGSPDSAVRRVREVACECSAPRS